MIIRTIAAALLGLTIAVAGPLAAIAQPGYHDNGQNHDGAGWHHDSDDSHHGEAYGHEQSYSQRGSISVRNSRHRTQSVTLVDTQGGIRGRESISPGERESFRVSARSGWTISVRQYGRSTQRYRLGDIGSYNDGRWYVRLR